MKADYHGMDDIPPIVAMVDAAVEFSEALGKEIAKHPDMKLQATWLGLGQPRFEITYMGRKHIFGPDHMYTRLPSEHVADARRKIEDYTRQLMYR